MSTTQRYAIIEAESGIVWGIQDAADEKEACRLLDESLKEFDRTYEDIGRGRFDGRSGYIVHLAPPDFNVDDGQNDDEIARVEALPWVANLVINWTDPTEAGHDA